MLAEIPDGPDAEQDDPAEPKLPCLRWIVDRGVWELRWRGRDGRVQTRSYPYARHDAGPLIVEAADFLSIEPGKINIVPP